MAENRMLSEDLLRRAREADVSALVELDSRGFLIGIGENVTDYVSRLEALAGNIAAMDQSLADEGTFSIEGMTVHEDNRIPGEQLSNACALTRELYGISLDWVPGFFITPPGLFFGGCAFYFFPDFFALFIIRESFRHQSRWLIYDRDELLAHELCHIARIAFGSRIFEEMFAYRTAGSAFRRFAGAIFRSPIDSYVFLGSTILLLIAQILQTCMFPSLWTWPFWAGMAGVICFYVVRLILNRRVFHRALHVLQLICPTHALTVLYRCSDREIGELAQLTSAPAAEDWLKTRMAGIRREVILARFFTPQDNNSTSPEEKANGLKGQTGSD